MWISLLFVSAPAFAVVADAPTPVILVDKKTNTLELAEYVDGSYRTLKKFHATLGQVKGDKEDEGDLKTPEGIYVFTANLTPPSLKPKFGERAFYVSFPNSYDKLAGRTGRDIMLHATNEPERLKRAFDSQGCVVVKNEEIREIQRHIRLNMTPILIFPESPGLTSEYRNPGNNSALRAFFDGWLKAWESKRIEDYISHYHSEFTSKGLTREQWKAYKASLNAVYETIEVGMERPRFYTHPKYSVVTFIQNYRSRLKSGGWGHVSRGTKTLFIAEERGERKIVAEDYSELTW